MPATAEQSVLAANPATDAQTLAELAYAAPDLWPAIAAHPNVYPGLLDWMRENGLPEAAPGPAVEEATAGTAAPAAGSGPAPSTVPAAPAAPVGAGASAPAPRPWSGLGSLLARTSRRAQLISGAAVVAAVLAVVLVVTLVVVPRQNASKAAAASVATATQSHDTAVSDFTSAAAACTAANAALADARSRAASAATTDPGTLKDPTLLDTLKAAVASAGGVAACAAPAMGSDTATIRQQADQTAVAAGTVQGAVHALGAAVDAVTASAQAAKDDAAAAAAAAAEATQQAQATAAAAARTWTFTSNDGYSFDLNLAIGASVTEDTFSYVPAGHDSCTSTPPLPGTDQVQCETAKLADVCSDFDPSTMVAIPVTASFTATTKGFDTPVAARFALGTTGSYGGPDQTATTQVEVATVYSTDGPQCMGPSGYGGLPSLGVNWATPMKTGGTGTFRFDVILQKWRTPASPNGDSALLDYLTVAPAGSTPSGTTTTFSSASTQVLTLKDTPVGG